MIHCVLLLLLTFMSWYDACGELRTEPQLPPPAEEAPPPPKTPATTWRASAACLRLPRRTNRRARMQTDETEQGVPPPKARPVRTARLPHVHGARDGLADVDARQDIGCLPTCR